MSALSDVIEILSPIVSDLDGAVTSGASAEDKAGEAVAAATAWGAQDHVMQAEQVRKDIEEANALAAQAKDRYESAMQRAQALEQG